MSSARKLRAELAAHLEPYGLSVELAPNVAGSTGAGVRTQSVAVYSGDRMLATYTLSHPRAVFDAVKALRKLRPEVPELPNPRPPRATRSRKAPPPTAPLPAFDEVEVEDVEVEAPAVEDGEALDEVAAAYVGELAEAMSITSAPPWQAIAGAAQRRRQVPGAGRVPERLHGCEVIARVRGAGSLDAEVPRVLVAAAADGLRRGLPTWLVRDPDGRLAVLVTNGEPAAA